MRVVVIGGTQFIGKRLGGRLLDAGHEVTTLHRKAEHPFGERVRNVVADRNDAAAVRGALAGRRFDAVYDISYDWERGTTDRQVEDTAKAIPGGLSHYIFMSRVGHTARDWTMPRTIRPIGDGRSAHLARQAFAARAVTVQALYDRLAKAPSSGSPSSIAPRCACGLALRARAARLRNRAAA
jgi:NAD(P)-dependent dehydrogenase (short-subunit alcohol dehydrogenase family)